MGRVLFAALLGGLAGLAAWAVAAPFDPGTLNQTAFEHYEHIFIFAMCGLIGVTLGGLNGSYQGSKAHLVRGGLIGLVLGTIGGYLGYSIGYRLVSAIFGDGFVGNGFGAMQIVARVIALSPFGALFGLAIGVTGRSVRQTLTGLVGGVLGAGLGGAAFDMVSMIMAPAVLAARGEAAGEVGSPGRFVYAVSTGLFIGLFTSLLQLVTRTAWVRLVLGRNEAKEWVVDAQNTFIGRNETAHVPIFGDPGVAPVHAVIQRHQGNYYLADCGSGAPTFVNGMAIQQVPLFSGAIITVGGTNLEFVLRAGSAPQKAAEAYRSQYGVPQGVAPAGYQPYAQPAAPAQPYPQPAPQQFSQPYPQPAPQSYPQPTPSAPTQVQPAAAPVGSLALTVVSGPLTGQRFEIVQPIEVGRDCPAIPMSFDGLISRRHATLAPGPVGIVLTDLGSTNGTFVNDQRVQSTTLRPGDLVKMGVTVFRVD